MSPFDPPLGSDVLTVRVPLALVPAVAEMKAWTSLPIATPRFVLALDAEATSFRLFAVLLTPVKPVPEKLYRRDAYVAILFLQ